MKHCYVCYRSQTVYTDAKGRAYCNKCSSKCLVCGEYFVPKNKQQKICSDECRTKNNRQKAYKSYQKKWYDLGESRACEVCGKSFIPKSANHKYCTPKCAKKFADESTKRDKYLIFLRDKFTCFYCGKTSYEDGKELHIDHVIPRDSGGKDIASNLVTACVECNLGKSNTRLPPNIEAAIFAEVAKRNKANNISADKPIYLVAGQSNRSKRSYEFEVNQDSVG